MKLRYISILVLLSFLLMAFNVPKGIQKRIEKEIKETYQVETYNLNSVNISQDIASTLPADFANENFFKIETEGGLVGYAYLAQAPSKTAQFDYLVLLDKDLIIKRSKVLAYREEYGGEIGSKRWLKQFIGKTKEDSLRYGDNIDAISGATISVRSMTLAMNNFLKSIKILHSKQLI